MKKFKYLLVGGLLACTTVASTACNFGTGGSDEEDLGSKIEVILQTDGGGLGSKWVERAAQSFEAKNANKQYGSYTGVKITATAGTGANLSSAETSGVALFDMSGVDTLSIAAGKVLDLTSFITTEAVDTDDAGQAVTIESKIDESARDRYKIDNKYLALPSIEYYPSLSYDVNLFDSLGLYFAKAGAEGTNFYCTILGENYTFTGDAAKKSCGPDGETGTSDDGLPSSLYELIALCDYMKTKKTVQPLNVSGQYVYYTDFMMSALMNAMMGWEKAQAVYSLNCDEMEIVTGFSDELLLPGFTAKKPITAKVAITEENGYLTTWAVEKYYAEVFMDLCMNKNWFNTDAIGSGVDQVAAQTKFIYSGFESNAKVGMHIDGSFWYNEATIKGVIDDYNRDVSNGGLGAGLGDGRKVAMMSLPVNFKDSVTENNGRGQVFVDMWRSMLVVNANVENTPGLKEATLDFVKHLYSDEQLEEFTQTTGVLKSLNYDVDVESSDVSYYAKDLVNTLKNEQNKVLYFEGGNETFSQNTSLFIPVGWGDNSMFNVDGSCYYTYRKANSYKTAQVIFKEQSTTKAKWTELYKGTATVTGEYAAIN